MRSFDLRCTSCGLWVAMGGQCLPPLVVDHHDHQCSATCEPPKAIPYVPEDLVALRWQHMAAMGKVCLHPLWITATTNSPTLGHPARSPHSGPPLPRLGPALRLPATQMSRSRGRGSSRAYAILPGAKLHEAEGERVKCSLGHHLGEH